MIVATPDINSDERVVPSSFVTPHENAFLPFSRIHGVFCPFPLRERSPCPFCKNIEALCYSFLLSLLNLPPKSFSAPTLATHFILLVIDKLWAVYFLPFRSSFRHLPLTPSSVSTKSAKMHARKLLLAASAVPALSLVDGPKPGVNVYFVRINQPEEGPRAVFCAFSCLTALLSAGPNRVGHACQLLRCGWLRHHYACVPVGLARDGSGDQLPGDQLWFSLQCQCLHGQQHGLTTTVRLH